MNNKLLIEKLHLEGYKCLFLNDKKLIKEELGIKNIHDHFLLFKNKPLTDAGAAIAYGFNMHCSGDHFVTVSYYNKHISRSELGVTHVIVHADNDNLIEQLVSHAKSLISLSESNKK